MTLMRSLHLCGGVASLALLGSAGAGLAAQPTGFGSAAFQGVRYCRDATNGGGAVLAADIDCTGPLNPNTRRSQTVITGGDGVAINSAFETVIGGSVESRVLFGELDLPVIKSGAWADEDTRVASTIVTYMGFSFGGTEETPYALDAVIDWTSSGAPKGLAGLAGTGPSGEFGGEGLGNLQLYLWDAAAVPAFAPDDDLAIIGFPQQSACDVAGVIALSYVTLGTAAAGPGAVTGSLNTACGGGAIMLQPGQSYVLFALMQTVANRNGFLDATNTVTVQLSEDLPPEVRDTLFENIVSARSLVPEPSSWAMLIAGFGLVGATLRRRRAALA